MVHAYIMVRTGPAASGTVREAILDLDGVEDAHVVAGEFDVIAEAEGSAVYDVLQVASTGIQGVEGVAETKTYVALS